MTREQLAYLEKLTNATAPGPWKNDMYTSIRITPAGGWRTVRGIYDSDGIDVAHLVAEHADANAVFIVAVREAVPALIAEIRRLQAENAALRQELEERPAMTAQDDPSPDRHPSPPPSDRKEPPR